MSKICVILFLLAVGSSSYSQTVIRGKLPSNLKDTIYIGITNEVKLQKNGSDIISAESENAKVSIKGDIIILHPRSTGTIVVTLHYKDTTIHRKFISTYLPDPKRK